MRYATMLIAAAMLAGVPALSGCKEEVYRKTETKETEDGSVKKDTKVTVNEETGTVTKTETKDVNKDVDHD